jgi:hypothetical protein
LVAAGYAVLTVAVCIFEAKRIRASGPDVITAFISLYVLQCCFPGIVIYCCLPLLPQDWLTGNQVFDRIYSVTDLATAFLVLGLAACTAFFFYAFVALNEVLLRRFFAPPLRGSYFILSGFPVRLVILLLMGFVLTSVSFYSMGDTLFERYANLILLRARSGSLRRTLLTTYGFGLTQTWAWLSIPTLFVLFERRGRDLVWFLCLFFAVAFAVLSADRRAIFIPILLAYLTLVLFDGRWRVRLVAVAATPILIWIAFGKEILWFFAISHDPGDVFGRYETVTSGILRAGSEIGITLVESCGTISLLDLDPRLGVDHLLSVLRRVPVAWFGWDFELPKAIVRVTTETFSTSDDSDIPPGLFGQMWLDFRVFGPVVWGFLLSVPLSIVQRMFALTIPTRQAIATLVLMVFVIALPLNTGSYDFTFSIDVIALLLCVWLAFKLVRVRVRSPSVAGVGSGEVGKSSRESLA